MKLSLLLIGGEGLNLSPNCICENNIKSNKKMHCAELFFLSGSFEDMGIFIYLLWIDIPYTPSKLRTKN